MQAVTKSKSNKAVGVDDLPGKVLRNDITCGFIMEYLNLCFQSGIIPDSWKKGIIQPIPKSYTDGFR